MAGIVQFRVSQQHSHNQYDGPRRWFNLQIHPTVEHLREAACRYRGLDASDPELSEAYACCQPAPTRSSYDEATDTWMPAGSRHWAGVIRLTSGRIHAEVIAHEMVHAALAIYRMDVKRDVRLGTGYVSLAREEIVAYIVGDLVNEASGVIERAGLWSPA